MTLLAAQPAAGAGWVVVHSPHFDVISDASIKHARRIAVEFEDVRGAIGAWFPGLEIKSDRMPIYALSSEGVFAKFTQREDAEQLAGFFFRDTQGGVIVVRLDVDMQQAYGVVYHEYFHAVTEDALPGFPLWLKEGLADIFAYSSISNKRLNLGLVSKSHVRLLASNKLLPLEQIVDPDLAAVTYADDDDKFIFYAQSWALTHFMIFEDKGAYWPKLLGYLTQLSQGVPEPEAWQRFFGDRKAIERALWQHITRSRFSYRTLEASVANDGADYTSRRLNASEVTAYRGQYLARVGDESARSVLSEALAGDDNSAMAHEALGIVAFREDKLDEARSELERALELDPERGLACFYLGRLEVQQKNEGWQERSVEDLLRAVRLDPSLAVAYADLARYYAQTDPTSERALGLALTALARAQSDPQMHLLVASLRRRQGEESQAKAEADFARQLAFVSSVAGVSNNVCWQGALQGLANLVMPSCEEAVRRDRDSGSFRDSRAVARALTGDLVGAAEDLRFFLQSDDADNAGIRARREAWLKQLEAGRNPIDQETLDELLLES